ncbi:MAG TPA: B-4DMT family transporter [Mycobacterium sp.]|nr:B-4DMT family transporter [Mycobacterium sp.]
MSNWILRGTVLAAVMVVVRLLQGAMINAWQEWAGLISVGLLLLFVICTAVWGVIDGRADATANRDPDRRQDLAMTWLLTGLLAGVLSGAVCWLIALVYKGLYTGGLINEVTTFAAFTALVVFLSGIVGVTFGRWRVDRQFAKEPEKHHGLGVKEERVDTDVFAAVRGDESPTRERGVAHPEERTASVATAERDAPTETIPTSEREAPTEAIPTTDDDARTEVIRTDTDPRHARPRSEPENE